MLGTALNSLALYEANVSRHDVDMNSVRPSLSPSRPRVDAVIAVEQPELPFEVSNDDWFETLKPQEPTVCTWNLCQCVDGPFLRAGRDVDFSNVEVCVGGPAGRLDVLGQQSPKDV